MSHFTVLEVSFSILAGIALTCAPAFAQHGGGHGGAGGGFHAGGSFRGAGFGGYRGGFGGRGLYTPMMGGGGYGRSGGFGQNPGRSYPRRAYGRGYGYATGRYGSSRMGARPRGFTSPNARFARGARSNSAMADGRWRGFGTSAGRAGAQARGFSSSNSMLRSSRPGIRNSFNRQPRFERGFGFGDGDFDFDDRFFFRDGDFDFDDCFRCGFGFGFGAGWPWWGWGLGASWWGDPWLSPSWGPPAAYPSTPSPMSNPNSATITEQASTVLLYLKDGTTIPVWDYWVGNGKLHYRVKDGGESALDMSDLDWQQTVDENAKRGVPITLQPQP